jgi:uncharacterized membrane protein (TIGR02234 family)
VNPRRIKLLTILVSALLAGVILGGWTQTWFDATLTTRQELAVTGDIAAPALTALALCVLVLQGALAIAGPFFRVVLAIIEALIGIAVVYSAVLAITGPATASAAAITTATGVGGKESTAELVATISPTIWPWITVIAGVLLIVVALSVLLTSRAWPGSSRKYQAVRLEQPDGGKAPTTERSAVDDWDALSSGDDPTGR